VSWRTTAWALVLRAGLTARQITILRAIAKYLRQAGIAFTDSYIQRTLNAHPDIAVLLVRLFGARLRSGLGTTRARPSACPLS